MKFVAHPHVQASRREEEYDVHAASVLQLLHGGLERRGTRSCLLLLPDKRAALHAVTFDLSAGAPVCLAALFPMRALADLWLLLPLTDLNLARVALVCQAPGVRNIHLTKGTGYWLIVSMVLGAVAP